MSQSSGLPGYAVHKERCLLFHPDQPGHESKHPLQGLVNFGPFSASLVNDVYDPIRVAVIGPAEGTRVVAEMLHEMEARHLPRERKQYLIEWPGFTRVFRVGLQLADGCSRLFSQSVEDKIMNSEHPHLAMGEAIVRALANLLAARASFDVVIIYLPERWSRCFWGPDRAFDLHHFVKATAAQEGVPTQFLNERGALDYHCRCSVCWRLGIALYTKAGGVPWKLAGTDPEAAFIGVSYAIREGDGPRFVTCCSQVFDSDGAGLEFIAQELDDPSIDLDNPYLSREQMRRLMHQSVECYRRRHGGRMPRRITVHKTMSFKEAEIDGCFDAFAAVEEVRLLTVQQDTLWRGMLVDAKGGGMVANGYPCYRGTSLPLGKYESLVWTQGNVKSVLRVDADFYKEGKGIPSPILLTRYAGHGSIGEDVEDVLGLTKMDWNNDSLYNRLPVTLSYASVLADTVKRMPSLKKSPYSLRLFM